MTTPFFLIEDTETLAMSGLSSEEYILLNSVSDGVTVNSQGIFSYVNTTFAEMVGYSVSELLGMDVLEVTAPEYYEIIRERTRKRQQGLEVVSIYELELVRKDGTCFPVEFNASRIDFDGKSSSLTIIRDISERKQAEKKLRESEMRFSGFMRSANDMFTMHDRDMHYIEVNDSWLQLAELERADVIGKHILDLFPWLKETGRYDDYLKVLETGEPLVLLGVEVVSLSGHDLILDISAFKAGDVLGVVTRDVTEQVMYRKRLELLHNHAASMASTESIEEVVNITYDTLVETLGFVRGSFGLVENDQLNHKYRWGTPNLDGFVMSLDGPGITVEVVRTGSSFRTGNVLETEFYVDMSDDPTVRSELAVPVIVSGKVEALINIESRDYDAFSGMDQRLVETLAQHVAAALSRIRYNNRLSAIHTIALELGVTESVEAIVETTFRIMKEVLRFQFSSFQLLNEEGLVTVGTIDDSNLGVVFPLTGKGITTRAAREGRTMLVGDVRDDPDFLHWSTDSRSGLAVPILSEDGVLGVLNVESLQLDDFTGDDAKLLEVLAQNVGAALFRIRAAEERSGFEGALFAERIRVEQEQELSQLKTRFMSTATHELRTPLSSIMGYTELIQDNQENLTETQHQYFDVIQRNVRRLSVLTDDLLDLQRLEEGKMNVTLEQVNISEMLELVKTEFTPILAEKNQTLVVSSVDVVLNMDMLRVMQVLVNLLSNASKFSPEGGNIVVDVVETGDGVQFSVSDQGVGVRAEDIDKLFKPFPGILVDGNVRGTGLGLSISKGIVELHSGKILAESEGLGKGSTFTFTIPIK